ncbi:uncharacterized protein LOC131212087 isoform X2 [Anopheles bellator]|uniref:uncharacterized protein LOC131212087 isoform X2 n=1 Tax=Anopheles bellator TaxID=139047 RepID=UPI002647FCDE|nr:uncharacterized protein LOC131212087 isoform X2 [Anopheles bellator]
MSIHDENNYLQDDWATDDFMDSLLKMNDTTMLFNEPSTGESGGTDELDEFMSRLSYTYAAPGAFGGEQQVMSPLSSHSGSDQEFHGFPSVTGSSSGTSLDGYFDDDPAGDAGGLKGSIKSELLDDGDFNMLDMLVSVDQPISSAASDSGLSSDHLDLDPNTEYEALSPALSSPGPSISERGGQNSPPHHVNPIQQPVPVTMKQTMTTIQSPVLPSGSDLSSIPKQPQVMLQRSAATLAAQQSQPRSAVIKTQPQTTMAKATLVTTSNPSVANVASTQPKPVKFATNSTLLQQQQQPLGVKTIITTGAGGTKKLLPNGFTTGKELKIVRMATMKNGQTVAVANGLQPVTTTAPSNKKFTLQLKNGTTATITTTGTAGPKGTATGTVLPKTVVLTSAPATVNGSSGVAGVRKIIRMQQQSQQNGRPILLPLSIQDLRTIKIVNANNLKGSKSANFKLAPASLLQKPKQSFVQSNLIVNGGDVVGDCGLSDAGGPSSSDSESYVFDDIMQQSNSVIAEVERHQQKHIISDSDVEPDGDDCMDDDDDTELDDIGKGRNRNGTYQKLVLTPEEKRLLAKEGISLPTSYPLTKHEERELKRIRRKIRNKISAQDSRKRKKEYVDGLEERVKQCTEENQNLVKRIKILQSQNHDLVSQMKRIQSLLTKGTSKTTQPATCLMVLLISMALVAVPNLKLGNTTTQQNIQDSLEMSELMQEPANDKLQVATAAQQSRRSLLFDTKESVADEEMNLEEIMSSFNANSLIANEHDYFTEADSRQAYGEPPMAKRQKIAPLTLIDYDVDDDVWNGGDKIRIKQEQAAVTISSTGGSAELFEQKVREFQDALHKSAYDSDVTCKAESSEPISELIVDRDLLDLVAAKGTNGLYGHLNLDALSMPGKDVEHVDGINLLVGNVPTATLGSNSPGADGSDARKLNASQQIQQQNNKRKLLL